MTLLSHLHINFNIYAAKFSNDLFLVIHTNLTKFPCLHAQASAAELGLGAAYVPLALPLFGPGASPLLRGVASVFGARGQKSYFAPPHRRRLVINIGGKHYRKNIFSDDIIRNF